MRARLRFPRLSLGAWLKNRSSTAQTRERQLVSPGKRGTRASNDPRSTSYVHLTPTDGKTLWGPTGRRLNIQPPTGGQRARARFGWWDRPLVVVTDASRRLCSASTNTEGVSMAFEVGKRVVAESESTDRRPRSGVVEEVVRGDPSPRYRIRWDDGHESIYTPASGALRAEQRPKRQRRAAAPKRSPT
jgi:Domain of unknown function (DUF1918)